MAADIFGFDWTVGDKAFTSEGAGQEGSTFVFGEHLSLVQQWNVQYQLNAQPIFECGSPKIYFGAKHANGTLTINRIVADSPMKLMDKFKLCKVKENTASLTASEACGGSSKVSLDFNGIFINGVGFSGQAQQAWVAEDVSFMFAKLGEGK